MTSIGLLTYSTKPRGSVVHACCLAESLTLLGHDVTLYALSKAGDRLYRELKCPVVYLAAAPAPANADALISQRIHEVADGLGQLRPRHDLYHAEDCLVASGLLKLRPELGPAPVVRTLHHWERFDSPFLQECQRRSVLQADAVVCVSRVGQRDVRRELGRACPIIANGVDHERFAHDERLCRWVRARFELDPGDVVILSVGGVEPRKNTVRALEAMAKVLRAHPTALWLIVGGASIWEHSEYRAQFRERLGRLEPNVRSRILELGSVTEHELTGLYQTSQILLCPSLQEGFGLCVLEAMAAGCAVVVSGRDPFTEYLTAAEASFVNPDSVTSIAEAVERLWSDAELCSELGHAARERARAFSWESVAKEHERLYRRLLETRSLLTPSVYEEPAHA